MAWISNLQVSTLRRLNHYSFSFVYINTDLEVIKMKYVHFKRDWTFKENAQIFSSLLFF